MPPRTTPWRLFKRKDSPVWWARRTCRGRKERVSTGYKRKGDAERLVVGWNRYAADPAYSAAQTTTLGQAVRRWLSDISPKIAEATLEVYTTKAGQLIRLLGAGTVLADVDARAIDAYVVERQTNFICAVHRSGDPANNREPCAKRPCAQGVTDSTVHKELQVLRWVLGLAKRRGEYGGEPSIASHASKYKPRRRWLSKDDAESLFGRISERFGADRGAHFAFFLATGTRLSEARRARRGDVQTQTINNAPVTTVHVHGTKTKKADRFVLVTSLAAPWLERALQGAPGKGASPLFRAWTNLQRDIKNACVDVGIEAVSPNDLRRTFASWHLHAGVERSLVAAMLGHTSTAMLDRVYGVHNVETRAALMAEFLWKPPTPRPPAPGVTKADAQVIQLDAERRRRQGR